MSQAHPRAVTLEDKLERLERGNELMRRDLDRPDVPASHSSQQCVHLTLTRIIEYSTKRDPLVHADENQQSSTPGCCSVM